MSGAREARALLAVLRSDWAAAERERPGPGAFLDLCRACDVHPTVHARLVDAGREDLFGAEVRDGLRAARRRVRHDNLLLLARVEQALDVLRDAGIVPVALKGLSTLHRFHASFDERTLDDVDLLVAPGELDRAAAALESAGWAGPPEPERTHWRRSSFELPLRSPGPVEVMFELHWSLGQRRRYRVDPGALLARAVPQEIAGRPVLRLHDDDAAAHLLLHHVQHYFDRRLKWALDLERIAAGPEFTWQGAAARLQAWGGRAAAGMALVHLGRLLPSLAPPEARRLLPAAAWRRALLAPLRSSHPLDLLRGTRRRHVQLWIAAVLLERPADLPGYLRHRAVRDREEAESDYNGRPDRPTRTPENTT